MPSITMINRNTSLVYPAHFEGQRHIHDAQNANGLLNIIKHLSQWANRLEVNRVPTDLTDSTGGTASAVRAVSAQNYPLAAFTAGTSDAPQKAAFDTAIGKNKQATLALVEFMNRINARLGIPLIDASAMTLPTYTPLTVPAQDLTITAASTGGSCANKTDANARLTTIRDNMSKLVTAVNRICTATGTVKLTGAIGGDSTSNTYTKRLVMADVLATGTAADGTALSTVSLTLANAEFTKFANNFATMAAQLNDVAGAVVADLTDSTGGSADTDAVPTLVAMTIPAAAAGAATTSSPKAGFDTQLGVIDDALAGLAARVNLLLRRAGATSGFLTDSTGGTVVTTLAAISNNLTAVDGSTGTVAVDQVTARAIMAKINNAIASLATATNTLADFYGERKVIDSTTGVSSTTLALIGTTGGGVGAATAVTLLDTDVDTYLGTVRDNIATLAAELNRFTNTTNDLPGAGVAYIEA